MRRSVQVCLDKRTTEARSHFRFPEPLDGVSVSLKNFGYVRFMGLNPQVGWISRDLTPHQINSVQCGRVSVIFATERLG